ncbi:MAG: MCE-family protein, partial [Actinomycetota bacterium]|nr:MCE-family protein [Actinomycetota bacterium]
TPYRYPVDLAKIGADTGPRCYGLPTIPNGKQIPHQVFDVGTDPYQNAGPGTGFTPGNLLELFFGPLGGATK